MDSSYVVMGGFAVFALALGYFTVRMAKHYIGKELKVQTVLSALTQIGIKKVDAKFFNELSNDGMQRMLTTVYNVMNFQKTLNPTAALGGSKSMQDFLGILQMQQQLGGAVVNPTTTGNPAA